MLRVKNVNLTKKGRPILKDISFDCEPGKITVLIGKSGAGKTSLLKCIAQLEKSYSGSIEFDEKNIKDIPQNARAELIGFVFQQFNLFPHMTVLENCAQPLEIVKKYDKAKSIKIAQDMLGAFGLKNLECSYPNNISGGQQQRVAIVRTLCFDPKIICLDEPTSALDPQNTTILAEMLKSLSNKGTTIILSSQDVYFVKAIADRVILLEDGCLIEEGDSEAIQLAVKNKISSFLNH